MTSANNYWFLLLRVLFQFVLIKLGIIIVGHTHLHSRIDSRLSQLALRAEYCIVDIPNNRPTAI